MTTLESTDLKQAREQFEQSRKRVVEVTTGLSGCQWQFKPDPGRWSIAENLEHMVIVEERVFGILERLASAPASPADHDFRKLDAIVIEKIPDRSITASAPEFLLPTGQCPPAVALERLFRNHQRLLEFVESTPDLREHLLDAPPLRVVTNGEFTAMDGYQWVLAAARHDERHVRQMLEVKGRPKYPA